MPERRTICPDCENDSIPVDRREFLTTVSAVAAASALPLWAVPKATAAPTPKSAAETAVKALFETMTPEQKSKVCFAWGHQDAKRGLLRTHVSNNWQITEPHIRSPFYTAKQQDIIHDIFKGLINPEWYATFIRQLKEDTAGKPWGAEQSIAIFGEPGTDKFEFVMTGRHMTLRADGNTREHVAFGGPIFYGHQGKSFNEEKDHPGNVFWPQALAANGVFKMLDGKQRDQALVAKSPKEAAVEFRGSRGGYPGLPVAAMAPDQKAELKKVLQKLIEPFRIEDREEAIECLGKQGGLDACSLAFYQDEDIGEDGVWDNWRIEGPAFVWYFRGSPHVHVWVNVADDPSVPTNARG
jgi:Protein of unknown function (DUF3500)